MDSSREPQSLGSGQWDLSCVRLVDRFQGEFRYGEWGLLCFIGSMSAENGMSFFGLRPLCIIIFCGPRNIGSRHPLWWDSFFDSSMVYLTY